MLFLKKRSFLFLIYTVTINGPLLFTTMLWAASAAGVNGEAAS